MDEDCRRHRARTLRARRSRGPRPAGPALPRNRAHGLRLVRRRRPLAVARPQLARYADSRSGRQGFGRGARHARPRILDSRRHRAAAAADVGDVRDDAHPVRPRTGRQGGGRRGDSILSRGGRRVGDGRDPGPLGRRDPLVRGHAGGRRGGAGSRRPCAASAATHRARGSQQLRVGHAVPGRDDVRGDDHLERPAAERTEGAAGNLPIPGDRGRTDGGSRRRGRAGSQAHRRHRCGSAGAVRAGVRGFATGPVPRTRR